MATEPIGVTEPSAWPPSLVGGHRAWYVATEPIGSPSPVHGHRAQYVATDRRVGSTTTESGVWPLSQEYDHRVRSV